MRKSNSQGRFKALARFTGIATDNKCGGSKNLRSGLT
jgi:hypothetical protein